MSKAIWIALGILVLGAAFLLRVRKGAPPARAPLDALEPSADRGRASGEGPSSFSEKIPSEDGGRAGSVWRAKEEPQGADFGETVPLKLDEEPRVFYSDEKAVAGPRLQGRSGRQGSGIQFELPRASEDVFPPGRETNVVKLKASAAGRFGSAFSPDIPKGDPSGVIASPREGRVVTKAAPARMDRFGAAAPEPLLKGR